jgi:hypothetical protein
MPGVRTGCQRAVVIAHPMLAVPARSDKLASHRASAFATQDASFWPPRDRLPHKRALRPSAQACRSATDVGQRQSCQRPETADRAKRLGAASDANVHFRNHEVPALIRIALGSTRSDRWFQSKRRSPMGPSACWVVIRSSPSKARRRCHRRRRHWGSRIEPP